MRSYRFAAALLFSLCCALFCLCSCNRAIRTKMTINPEILRLIQVTEAELSECAERCRSKAEEYPDKKEYLLALANSQQILADYHEIIIDALQKKYKFERTSTDFVTSEMDPTLLVLAPPEDYARILDEANPDASIPEILNILKFTKDNLKAAKIIEAEMNLTMDSGEVDPPPVVFYICTLCGRLSTEEPDEKCPVCGSDRDKIVQLGNGELPSQKKEYNIVGK